MAWHVRTGRTWLNPHSASRRSTERQVALILFMHTHSWKGRGKGLVQKHGRRCARITYSLETAGESAHVFCGEISPSPKSRCNAGSTFACIGETSRKNGRSHLSESKTRAKETCWENFRHKNYSFSIVWTRGHQALQIKQLCNNTSNSAFTLHQTPRHNAMNNIVQLLYSNISCSLQEYINKKVKCTKPRSFFITV